MVLEFLDSAYDGSPVVVRGPLRVEGKL